MLELTEVELCCDPVLDIMMYEPVSLSLNASCSASNMYEGESFLHDNKKRCCLESSASIRHYKFLCSNVPSKVATSSEPHRLSVIMV